MLVLAGSTIGALCVLALTGMPIILALATSVVIFLLVSGGWMLSMPQQTLSGLMDYILVTLPLFILAGGIMNSGGIADRLFAFAGAMFGWMRGGLAHVNVGVSLMFGGMIGTSVADLAGTGSVIIPRMKKAGYPGPFSAALTATSSGVGILLPPSSPMILYSAVTGTSLGALFLAGIVPGLLMGVVLMATIGVMARIHGWRPAQAFETRELLRTGRAAILPMGLPVLLIGGLVFGVFTPSEAGAFAVAYALVLAMGIYRSLDLRGLYRVLVEAAILTGEILLVVGLSTALGWALSQARVPMALAEAIAVLFPFESSVLQILALLLLALIAGMVLDPLIPMIMPVLLPALIMLDVDLIHFGVLIVVTVVIGQVTPPVALALLVAAQIGRENVFSVIKANTPFLVVLVAFLVLLVAFPALSTWLPAMAG